MRPLGLAPAAAVLLALAFAVPASAADRLEGHGGPIRAVSVSADGERALTASFDYSAILWDVATGRILHRFAEHDAAVNDAAFAGSRIVTVGDDGVLRLFDRASGALAAAIATPPTKVLDVAVSPDGTRAATARWDRTVRVHDLPAAREVAVLQGHRGNVNAVAWGLDGALFSAAVDGTVLRWDLKTGRADAPVVDHGWGINVLATLPDGRLAWGAVDGTAAVTDLETGETRRLAERGRPIQAVDVEGGRLAFGDAAGWVGLFDAATLAPLDEGRVALGPVFGLALLPGERALLHAGLDDAAARWRFTPSRPEALAGGPRRFQARATSQGGDVSDPGELEFRRKCSVCHTLTPDGANRAGPTLHGVFGRRAGALPGYNYSDALLGSDIVWTHETIGRLFADGPDVVTPGTKMPIQVLRDVERRDALLRYLAEATKPGDHGRGKE